MTRQRTYWHLQALGRKPTEYDIVSSKLLYYPERGFAVQTPITDWHERYQRGTPLRCRDWERFSDPRATTYTKYVDLQRDKETFVDGLLASIEETDYDARLAPEWLARLDRVFAPLRYPAHGLQMAASYVGALAPSGKLAIVSLFQAADEMRRVQRCAYRLCQLNQRHPELGKQSLETWERDPIFQPLRELIERLLVTYDWGEAFVALNLVVKPAFDLLFMVLFGDAARAAGDDVLQKVFWSLLEDCSWHRDWSRALCALLIEDDPRNAQLMSAWCDRWQRGASSAATAVVAAFVDPQASARACADVDAHLRGYWAECGLSAGSARGEVVP